MSEQAPKDKNTQEANEREALFQMLFEETSDAYLLIENNTFIDCNKAAVEMLGATSKKEVLSLHPADISPETQPDGQNSVEKADEMIRVALAEGSNRFEWAQRKIDGTDFWVEVLLNSIYLDNRRIIHAVWRDITKRKEQENTLLRLASIVEASNEAIFSTTPKGEIISWNAAAENMFGYSPEEIIGKPAMLLAPPEGIEEAKQIIGKLMQGKKVPAIETIRMTKDGRRLNTLVNNALMKDATGKVLGFSVTINDITERKELERQIQENFKKRGEQVRLSTEISQEISQATELSDLFEKVVTLTKENLGYYHTQLLRYDTIRDAVLLIQGYGEIGEKMLAEGHAMPMGVGLIGAAAATGKTILRPDLADDPDWQPNPILPDTRGEIAVPIKLGDNILGVLDIQSDTTNALTEDDQLLLEGLCGQIAVAIEQTRIKAEMEEHLEEVTRLSRSMRSEGWERYRKAAALKSSFVYDKKEVRPADELGLAEELFANIPVALPDGEVLGELGVVDDPENPLSDEDKILLEKVSEQVALALESARLFEETQAALSEVQQLGSAVEQSIDGMAIAGMDGNIQFVNRAWAEMHGYTTEELQGKPLALFHTEEQLNEEVNPFNLKVQTEGQNQGEVGHKRKDGSTFPTWMTVSVMKNNSGEPIALVASAQDITERKEAEIQLRESQERAQHILESITLPMVITRVSDNVYTFVNQHAADTVRVPIEEMINRPALDFYAMPEDREEFVEALRAHGLVSNMQVLLKRSDGSTFWALLSARFFIYEGEQSILATIIDISDRIAAQEATAKRAAELATVAQISTQIASLRETEEILENVVELSKERFQLYHAHIYMLDEESENLVLAAGAGEAGKAMVADKWQIPLAHPQSLVARAARTKEGVIVNDVRAEEGFLKNPLLPDTASELAVPLIAENAVIGVLDVQSDELNHFTSEDLNIQTTLATQIAVAIQNVRSFKATQEQAEYEAKINLISQRIQGTTNVEEALQVAVRELGRALGAKQASIQLDTNTKKR